MFTVDEVVLLCWELLLSALSDGIVWDHYRKVVMMVYMGYAQFIRSRQQYPHLFSVVA
jgi:hypothetical protein